MRVFMRSAVVTYENGSSFPSERERLT